MLVQEIMTDIVRFVAPTATLRDALTIFDDEEIRHLPVVSEERGLVGMISDRDLRGLTKVYVAPGEPNIMDSPVSDYMRPDVISVGPESTVVSAIDMITHLRVGALPVIDSKTEALVGILSYIDILEAARDRF